MDVGLTHVALPVRDLAASVGFYSRYARLRPVHERDGVVWLSDRTRPFVVVLIRSPRVEHPLRPLAHLGVACPSRAEVDRLCARASGEGCLTAGPRDDGPPVGYWAFLRDPDGHALELSFGQEVGLAVERADPAEEGS